MRLPGRLKACSSFFTSTLPHPDGCLALDADRILKLSQGGQFNAAPEWTYQVEHPVDRDRAIDGTSDLFHRVISSQLDGQTDVLEATVNTEVLYLKSTPLRSK